MFTMQVPPAGAMSAGLCGLVVALVVALVVTASAGLTRFVTRPRQGFLLEPVIGRSSSAIGWLPNSVAH